MLSFQIIPPAFFSGLDLDTDLMMELVSSLTSEAISSDQAAQCLLALTKSTGFSVNIMFLDDSQKKSKICFYVIKYFLRSDESLKLIIIYCKFWYNFIFKVQLLFSRIPRSNNQVWRGTDQQEQIWGPKEEFDMTESIILHVTPSSLNFTFVKQWDLKFGLWLQNQRRPPHTPSINVTMSSNTIPYIL